MLFLGDLVYNVTQYIFKHYLKIYRDLLSKRLSYSKKNDNENNKKRKR
jgi:hypothetical protein